jgi:hypothetical protein
MKKILLLFALCYPLSIKAQYHPQEVNAMWVTQTDTVFTYGKTVKYLDDANKTGFIQVPYFIETVEYNPVTKKYRNVQYYIKGKPMDIVQIDGQYFLTTAK